MFGRPLIALLAGLVLALPDLEHAHAQHPDDADARAAEHYEKGLALYNLADFDRAIVELKAAYELSRKPQLLYNIGQAYRFQRPPRCADALWYFRAYARAEPAATQAAGLQRLLVEMQECAKHEPPLEPAPPIAPIQPVPSPRGTSTVYPRIGIAVSLLVVGTGAGLLVWSDREFGRLQDRCAPSCTNEDVASGARAQGIGSALVVAGGGALVGAVVWWLLARSANEPEQRSTIGLSISPQGFSARMRF